MLLYEAGYPVEIARINRIINRIEGKDYILVVPDIRAYLLFGLHASAGRR